MMSATENNTRHRDQHITKQRAAMPGNESAKDTSSGGTPNCKNGTAQNRTTGTGWTKHTVGTK